MLKGFINNPQLTDRFLLVACLDDQLYKDHSGRIMKLIMPRA